MGDGILGANIQPLALVPRLFNTKLIVPIFKMKSMHLTPSLPLLEFEQIKHTKNPHYRTWQVIGNNDVVVCRYIKGIKPRGLVLSAPDKCFFSVCFLEEISREN